MKWCNDCKQIVDEEYIEESEGHDELDSFGGFYPSEEYEVEVCSECGSDDLEEPGECIICGEPCDPAKEICPDCEGQIDAEVDGLIDYFKKYNDDLKRFDYLSIFKDRLEERIG